MFLLSKAHDTLHTSFLKIVQCPLLQLLRLAQANKQSNSFRVSQNSFLHSACVLRTVQCNGSNLESLCRVLQRHAFFLIVLLFCLLTKKNYANSFARCDMIVLDFMSLHPIFNGCHWLIFINHNPYPIEEGAIFQIVTDVIIKTFPCVLPIVSSFSTSCAAQHTLNTRE